MPIRAAVALLLLAGPALLAQIDGGPTPLHVPKSPPAKEALARREALRLYGAALVHERNNRLLEAAAHFEKAAKLDPESAAIARALVPLYLALDRGDDAVKAGEKVLTLDPDDHVTASVLARWMRRGGDLKGAMAMLRAAGRSKTLGRRPDQRAQVWFDLAQMQEVAGQLAEAEASLRKVAAIVDDTRALMEASRATQQDVDTQAAETYEKLGQVCLKLGKVKEAEAAFAVARKKDPYRAPRLAYDLARVYRDQGKPREALAQVEAYLGSLPHGAEAYELRIGLQRITGADKEVVPSLKASGERDPHNLGLKMILARELCKAGRIPEAELVYVEALVVNPTADVFKGLFSLQAAQGARGLKKIVTRLDAAIAGAVGAPSLPGISDANDTANARTMLNVIRADRPLVPKVMEAAAGMKTHVGTRSTLATQGARQNHLTLAEALFRSCLDEDMGDMEAETYSGLLQVLQLRHRHEDVVTVSQKGLEKAKHTPKVLFHRAMAYSLVNLDRMKEAMQAADAALAAAEKQQTLACRKLKAFVLGEMGKGAEAIETCRALVKEYNHGADGRDARLALARAHQAAGELDESERLLEKILEEDSSDAGVCNDLGYGYADRGKKLAEAERLIRKALELERKQRQGGPFLDPDESGDNAAYVDSLGWVLFKAGKVEEARKELERATRLPHGDEPVLWDHLGDVYAALKMKGKAGEAWKRAAALYVAGARRTSEPRYKELLQKLRP